MASMTSAMGILSSSRPLAATAGVEPIVQARRYGSDVVGRRSSDVVERAEAAVALLEVADGLEQVLPVEVGPQHRCEPQLRVGRLPQQEVRRPLLAAGP